MARVFISYRRNDCPYVAHLIHELLIREDDIDESDVFLDVSGGIRYGEEFGPKLQDALNACRVLVVLIGDGWLGTTPSGQRTLFDDKNDWVLREIRTALERRITVIPVLVDGATLPRKSQLPADVQSINDWQAAELPSGSQFSSRVKELVGRIKDSATRYKEVVVGRVRCRLIEIPQGPIAPFYLAEYPVTQEFYGALTNARPSHYAPPRSGLIPDRPVERVAWDQAVDFCNKLSDVSQLSHFYEREGDIVKTNGGTGYRLPTVAEWDYACAAGATTRWCFGADERLLSEYGWHHGNSDDETKSVGTKLPNDWGLYDMYGNVWEWCFEEATDPPLAESTEGDATGDADGSGQRIDVRTHVIRGGSCNSTAAEIPAAPRNATLRRAQRSQFIGFRIARSII